MEGMISRELVELQKYALIESESRMSSSGVQVETSSTNPRRWVMPPLPSSPGLPFWSLCLARSLRSLSSGRRRQATTSEAKMGDSGQPWLTPSSMTRVRQVPSAHLWWTVPGSE